jgi:hypothetical protein
MALYQTHSVLRMKAGIDEIYRTALDQLHRA